MAYHRDEQASDHYPNDQRPATAEYHPRARKVVAFAHRVKSLGATLTSSPSTENKPRSSKRSSCTSTRQTTRSIAPQAAWPVTAVDRRIRHPDPIVAAPRPLETLALRMG